MADRTGRPPLVVFVFGPLNVLNRYYLTPFLLQWEEGKREGGGFFSRSRLARSFLFSLHYLPSAKVELEGNFFCWVT